MKRYLDGFILFLCAVSPLVFLTGCSADKNAEGHWEVDSATVQKVYDAPEGHVAFPDLVLHGGSYYLSFREGTTHMSEEAVLKILRSPDGKKWNDFGILALAGEDLRGAYFLETGASDPLCALVHSRVDADKNMNRTHFVSMAVNGDSPFCPKFSRLVDFGYSYDQPNIDIVFGYARYKGRHYAVVYGGGVDTKMRVALVVSDDGEKWETLSDPLIKDGNEADILIRDNKLYAIARAQTSPWYAHGAILDLSTGKLENFRFDKAIHAPRLFSRAGKDYLLGRFAMHADPKYGRAHEPFMAPGGKANPQTALLEVDWENKKLKWILNFPNGDGPDNAYPGIARMDENRYLVTYYSRDGKPVSKGSDCWHEPGTCIWTAELVYKK